MALKMGGEEVVIKYDPQLVTSQIKGEYQLKYTIVNHNITIGRAVMANSNKVEVQHIPIEQNWNVDLISKLIISKVRDYNKNVIHERRS